MCDKSKRIKITRTVSPESYEKLRTRAFTLRKTEGEILDDLLKGV